MTITTDLWTELQINTGRLAPGARGMARDEAARQYNESNCLTVADPDFLYTPEAAQRAVHDALRLAGIDVADHRDVVLTDLAAGPRAGAYAVNIGQVETACEQYRLVTGAAISAEALIDGLQWA
ncbi:hypothetical protein ACIQYZ_13490 [Rhodococcus erythropolis]